MDNFWLQGVAIVLPEVGKEFADGARTAWMTFALYIGLILGAGLWGVLADLIGRRPSFNATLLIGGVFGVAAGAAPSFVGLGGLLAALGFGVGGSLPVDGMLFLEFIPQSHQWLLTLLSVFWALGQLLGSLLAWPLIANYSCAGSNSDPTATVGCNPADNMGWRYTLYTLGGLTLAGFFFRFVIFQLPESPKFLLAHGRDVEAVAVVRDIARRNGKEISPEVFSVAILRAAAGENTEAPEEDYTPPPPGLKGLLLEMKGAPKKMINSCKGLTLSSFKPGTGQLKPLFATGKLAYNTSTIWFIWSLIGLAYPLYNAFLPTYLATRNGVSGSSDVNKTYRDYAIISACGVPGSIIAAWMVELPRSGRRGALAIGTLLTGAFVFALTGAPNDAGFLGLNCAAALVQNQMYGILYAVTPESFPAPSRGTGDGVAASLNRITGAMAPIIKIYAGEKNASAPLFTSGGLFILAALLAATLTVETRGKAAL